MYQIPLLRPKHIAKNQISILEKHCPQWINLIQTKSSWTEVKGACVKASESSKEVLDTTNSNHGIVGEVFNYSDRYTHPDKSKTSNYEKLSTHLNEHIDELADIEHDLAYCANSNALLKAFEDFSIQVSKELAILADAINNETSDMISKRDVT